MEDDRRNESGPIKLTRRGKNADSAANTQPPKLRGRPKKFLPTVTPEVQENAVFQDINGKSCKILFMLMLQSCQPCRYEKWRFVWPKTFTGMQWGDKFFGFLRGSEGMLSPPPPKKTKIF